MPIPPLPDLSERITAYPDPGEQRGAELYPDHRKESQKKERPANRIQRRKKKGKTDNRNKVLPSRRDPLPPETEERDGKYANDPQAERLYMRRQSAMTEANDPQRDRCLAARKNAHS